MDSGSFRTLLFVYGTLKRGGINHQRLAGQTFLGEARTPPGFRLYDLGEYPGMIPATEDRIGVYGEVWSVDANTLARLDAFEGTHEGLYIRTSVPLLPPFADVQVETYLYALSVQNRVVVADGRWRDK